MPINKITHVCLTHDKVRARNEKMLEDAIPYSIGSLVKDHADEKTAMRALQNI